MKTTILLMLLTLGVIAQNTAPISFFYDGTVVAFANTNKDFSSTVIDTTVGQIRKITIAADHSLFEVQWQLENNNETLFPMEYYIEKAYPTTVYNETTKKGNNHYVNYLAFDSDHYPMMLMISENESHGYLYYYWSSEDKAFKKSEKIVFAAKPMKNEESQ